MPAPTPRLQLLVVPLTRVDELRHRSCVGRARLAGQHKLFKVRPRDIEDFGGAPHLTLALQERRRSARAKHLHMHGHGNCVAQHRCVRCKALWRDPARATCSHHHALQGLQGAPGPARPTAREHEVPTCAEVVAEAALALHGFVLEVPERVREALMQVRAREKVRAMHARRVEDRFVRRRADFEGVPHPRDVDGAGAAKLAREGLDGDRLRERTLLLLSAATRRLCLGVVGVVVVGL